MVNPGLLMDFLDTYRNIQIEEIGELKDDVLTEFKITGFGIGDILDLSTKITCRYEIETRLQSAQHKKKIQKYARKGLDIIIVFTLKLPKDEYERYKYLKDVIIVPD